MTLELEMWEFIALLLIPEIALGVGVWLGASWRHETVRALEKSLDDLRNTRTLVSE